MEKLGFKHLAPYLPYGLKCRNSFNEEVYLLGLSIGNNSVSNELWVFRENGKYGRYLQGYLYECKPLLHPLSRLTEQMARDCGYATKEDFILQIMNKTILVELWEDLIKNHWDVSGLIEKGLAIEKPLNNH